MVNAAMIRDANGIPAMFVGSKTGRDDAPSFLSGSETKSAGCDGPNGMHFRPGPAYLHPGQASRNSDGMFRMRIAGPGTSMTTLVLIPAFGLFA